MDNLDTLSDLLRGLTFRELMDLSDFLSSCVVDAESTESVDFAHWLLAWADAQKDAARKEADNG